MALLTLAAAASCGGDGASGRPTPTPTETASAAPWSISHNRPCQSSRFGFCGERSTLVHKASSQTISAARSGAGGWPAAGL